MSSKRSAAVRLILLAAVVTALAVPTTSGAGLLGLTGACPGQTYEQPFLRWLDIGNYVLMPNGGLENGSTGWRLSGGAKVASGNETFAVGGATDAYSLALPAGSSATTGTVCVGTLSPTLRFFARNSGSPLTTLKVEVLYPGLFGQTQALTVALLSGGGTWQPTLPVAFLANLTSPPLLSDGSTSVAFRFTPQGSLGDWSIDDVYVDPFKGE